MSEFIPNRSNDMKVGCHDIAYHSKKSSQINLCSEGRKRAILSKKSIPSRFVFFHKRFNSCGQFLFNPSGPNNRNASIRLAFYLLNQQKCMLNRLF